MKYLYLIALGLIIGATAAKIVDAQPIQRTIYTRINTNNGAPLTQSNGSKLKAIRCNMMSYSGEFNCSGDTCSRSGLTVAAKGCRHFQYETDPLTGWSVERRICDWRENGTKIGDFYYINNDGDKSDLFVFGTSTRRGRHQYCEARAVRLTVTQ